MPSLKQLTGRPSPMALPDPAEASMQAKPCNVRRSPWPFRVMDWDEEVIVSKPTPAAQGTAASATPEGTNTAKIAEGATSAADMARRICDANSQGAIDAARLVAGAILANDIARRTADPKSKGAIEAARLVYGNVTATTIKAERITASGVEGVFPGALHANSVTAAWAMSNGLGHLVRKP